MGMPIFLRVVQYIGFITSTSLNSLLTILILTKSSRKIGSYKNLMLAFSIYSIFYACIEFCVQPVMHSKGAMFMVFVDSFLKDFKQGSMLLLCMYVGTFGLCISLLAAHFFYRYLAICKPHGLTHLEGFRMIKLFIPGLIMSNMWASGVYLFLQPTDYRSNMLSDALKKAYDIDIYDTPYIVLSYYHYDSSNNLIIDWWDWSVALLAMSVQNICITTMITCGIKCYKALEKVSNMSRRTKDLNRQLFRTLVVQTLVPLCTLFTPVAVLFTIPMFSIELGTLANAPGLYASIYPALDALVVIFMIRDFRETVLFIINISYFQNKMAMPIFLRIVQYIGFISSTSLNSLLTILILTKSSRKIGSYKNLMLAFSIYSIFYACIEFCVQPVMHSKGAIFMMFVDSFFRDYKDYSIVLLCMYVGTFGLCLSLLAAHFFYRYLAICKPHCLTYLEGYKMVKLFIPGIIMASLWSMNLYLVCRPTKLKSDMLSQPLREAYDTDIYDTPYVALSYYHFDSNHTLILDWQDWSMCFTAMSVQNICITTMIICGIKCYTALEKVSNMSRRTKDLNRQLFRTLVVQTMVPLCTLFTPVAVLFTIPIFSIELGTLANAPGLYISVYPAFDALIVIFMIRDYRETVLCQKRKVRIAMTSTNDSSTIHRS